MFQLFMSRKSLKSVCFWWRIVKPRNIPLWPHNHCGDWENKMCSPKLVFNCCSLLFAHSVYKPSIFVSIWTHIASFITGSQYSKINNSLHQIIMRTHTPFEKQYTDYSCASCICIFINIDLCKTSGILDDIWHLQCTRRFHECRIRIIDSIETTDVQPSTQSKTGVIMI